VRVWFFFVTVVLYSKCTRVLTYQNLCHELVGRCWGGGAMLFVM
jgi:hypothetical protein